MSKDEFALSLGTFEESLKELQLTIRRAKIRFIRRKDIQESARAITTNWFEKFDPKLDSYGILSEIREKYSAFFKRLLALASTGSQSTSYTNLIEDILKGFHEDISIPFWRASSQGLDLTTLYSMHSSATDEEKDYLDEAIGCAKHKFLRAATILTWSAAIHRMHKKVEKIGFATFNQKTLDMKAIDSGRYKRFKKSFEIHSLSELQIQIFDNDLLWILEYMELIDGNQHDRLEICFTMRNNSGHPGEAKIGEENFLSFCSDIYKFVFANPKFAISGEAVA